MAKEPEFDLADWIRSMSLERETMLAIISGSTVEDWLVHVLKSKMRNLSSQMEERLFRGYGPLSTFSAKIDVAYALSMFDANIYNDLRAIKDIRNAFAHTKEVLHFNSPALAPHIQKLTGWKRGCDPYSLFSERANACVEVFKPHLDRAALVKAILEYKPPDASPDKSGEPRPRHQTPLDESEEKE